MRIAFVGKGGSGKTTLAALLSTYIAEKKLPIFAIDADINQHFAVTLGMSPDEARALPPLGIEIARIKEYIRGNNPRISSSSAVVKTTPPGIGSRLLRLSEPNPIFNHFVRSHHGVHMMAVGEFTEEDLGIRCYHSKVGAVELILSHLIDAPNEYVIVDMTAGADSFASGLFTKFDITFLIVEPTLKSMSVYDQYKKYAREHDICIKVIGNKVENQRDRDFIASRTGEDCIALLTASRYIKNSEQGARQQFSELEHENFQALDALFTIINKQKRNWNTLYNDTVYFHLKNAESWANAAVGEDIRNQVDPDFSIEKIIQ